MSCSPSASARTVTAHSLKATGIGKKKPPKRRVEAICNNVGRDAGDAFLRTVGPVSREIPGFWLFQCPNYGGEVLFAVALLGGPREQWLHERPEPQLHAKSSGLVQA